MKQAYNYIEYKFFSGKRAFDPKSFVKKCRANEMSDYGEIYWWRRCVFVRFFYKIIKSR